MSESMPVWAPSRTYTPMATVEAQLDASFAAAGYRVCACGAMILTSETRCYPCSQGNRARGPIYGASLAQPRAITSASCRACAVANERIDALLDQNDAQAIENSDLARQVVSLKGHLEAMAAQVRQGKITPAP